MVSKATLALLLGGGVSAVGLAFILTRAVAYSPGQRYDIAVTVLDQNGTPVQAANVTIVGVGGGVTGASGQATITGVPISSYTLNIDALGFNPFSATIVVGQGSTSFVETLTPTGTCSCTNVSCPCGQRCNPTAGCICTAQTPNAIVAPPTFSFSQTWVVTSLSIPPIICGMAYPGACPPGAPPCNLGCNCQYPNFTTLQVMVTVVDIGGRPVCGVNVSAGLANTMQHWSIPCGPFGASINGDFLLSLVNPSATTDSNGVATFSINIIIANLGTNAVCPSPLGCQCNRTVSVPFSVFYSAPGVPAAATALDMQALICGFQSF